MNEVRQYIRLVLAEWTDEEMVMTKEPPKKDLEAPEEENQDAMDPFANANNGQNALLKSKAQAAGVVRGSGRMGGGRNPSGGGGGRPGQ